MLAIQKGRIEISKFIIESGANINLVNDRGDTALSLAIINDSKQIAKMLIQKGANINIINNNVTTPLII